MSERQSRVVSDRVWTLRYDDPRQGQHGHPPPGPPGQVVLVAPGGRPGADGEPGGRGAEGGRVGAEVQEEARVVAAPDAAAPGVVEVHGVDLALVGLLRGRGRRVELEHAHVIFFAPFSKNFVFNLVK